MASVPALINSELLKWARTTSGYALDSAAEKLGVEPNRLKSWESGTENLTIPQLRKISKLYKRPLAAFFLPEPPKETLVTHDFRLKPNSAISKTPELLQAIRIANSRREIALELYQQIHDKSPDDISVQVSMTDHYEKTAEKLRSYLNVTVSSQKSWKEADAFARWRAAIERVNVLVFQVSRISTEVMRGFSIAKQPYPVMVLNSADPIKARIFSMMHEFTHIALRQEGVCDLRENSKQVDQNVETYCNLVAGAILVPETALMSEPECKDTIDAADIESLASRYRVSREVVLRRLLILKKIKKSFYEDLYGLYQKQYVVWRKEQQEQESGPRYWVRAYNSAGPLFSRLVLENYYQDKITASDVSDYLAVKMNYLDKFEKLAWR